MALNYYQRLQNLQQRKYDPQLRKSLISESFGKGVLPENIEYLLEATKPINNTYNNQTIEAANRVQNHLEKALNLHFSRAYRTQGSVKTKTNIRTYSDIDLLSIIDKYYFLGPGVANNNPYTGSNHDDDIIEMRRQAVIILKQVYNTVDDSGSKCISIENKSLNRKVDIVFAFWLNSLQYEQNNSNEYYRGIYLFDFPKKQREADYPFATIGQVNSKGDATSDGSRKGIRLLKNLRSDSDKINLTSFMLTTVVHSINNSDLFFLTPGTEINIAMAISRQLEKMINDSQFRKNVESPNGLEKPLNEDTCIPSLEELKKDLDQLILDCAGEIKNERLQKSILNY
jgi:hypothetical protein